ncbi:hypothetical protein O3Q50_05410 [Enterococcus lactis]|nr:hypothetical protein [Enterococcus lactis]
MIITDDTKTPSGTRSLPMTKRVKKALLTLRNQVIKEFGFYLKQMTTKHLFL